MAYGIIDQFYEGVKGTDESEDMLVVTPNYVAVIDGATSKSAARYEGKTGGRLAAEAVAHAIQELPRTINPVSAADRFTKAVHEEVVVKCFPGLLEHNALGDRPAAMAVVYSDSMRQVWSIGDSSYRIGKRPPHYGKKEVDVLHAKLRAKFNQAALDRGYRTLGQLMEEGGDLGREIIMRGLQEQPLLMNFDNDYGVIDGRRIPDDLIQISPVPKGQLTLATDGFFRLDVPLQEALEYQLEYYKHDPLLIGKHQSTKGLKKGNRWHDDMTRIDLMIS